LILFISRPRPDFLARCFPDGDIDDSMVCKGNEKDVIDGYKSFPSGHSACKYALCNSGLFTQEREGNLPLK
jgi:membrane-associated phospholipid phosphatase